MPEVWHGVVADPMFGIESVRDLNIHDREKCEGGFCPFHNPSEHRLRDAPIIVRLDKQALVERRCPHGAGHTDPDSLAYYQSLALTLGLSERQAKALEYIAQHGCDGCCREEENP